MQVTHLWRKFDLYGIKVVLVLVLLVVPFLCQAQKSRWAKKNNPNYDERKISYGFLIGLHSSTYQIKYSDEFVYGTPKINYDSVHSVTPAWAGGFQLGFIVNYRLTDFLDLRLTPKVSFFENKVTYRYTDDTPTDEQKIETTMVEFPLLLKYKSERRGNIRMYMIGGVSPAFAASGKKEFSGDVLEVANRNVSIEAGFGFDLYYPLFKFSPEIRFSRGLMNMLGNDENKYGKPLKYMNTNTITVYFLFQ